MPSEYCGSSTSTGIKPLNVIKPSLELLQAPYQPHEEILKVASSRPLKRKNYKGQTVSGETKVKVVRPRLIDTRNIARQEEPEKKIFVNAKKVESGIKIKILPKAEGKKRIVIKDSR